MFQESKYASQWLNKVKKKISSYKPMVTQRKVFSLKDVDSCAGESAAYLIRASKGNDFIRFRFLLKVLVSFPVAL